MPVESTDVYQVMRALTAEEHAALEAAIVAAGGARDPVWVDQHGHVIDGHNRKAICEKHGLPYPENRIEVRDAAEPRTWAGTTTTTVGRRVGARGIVSSAGSIRPRRR